MQPIKSIGEFTVTILESDEVFFFKPSFKNIMKIGTPSELVEIFYRVSGVQIYNIVNGIISTTKTMPVWAASVISGKTYYGKAFGDCINILNSCCYSDCEKLTGYYKFGKNNKLLYSPGLMSESAIIANARNLLEHGMIGKADYEIAQKHEKKEYSKEFNALDYIDSARIHFKISKDEAMDLTMTEFHRLLKQKYPQKDGFTRSEYDKITDDYFKEREQRRRLLKEAKK